MWVHNGVYYRLNKTELDHMSNQMAVYYVGYTNDTLKNPIKLNTYITSIKEFKNESDLEDLVHKDQIQREKSHE